MSLAARRALVLLNLDAPRLPLLAAALDTDLSALTRDGHSVVLGPTDLDPAVVALRSRRTCLELSVHGADRRLTVWPGGLTAGVDDAQLTALRELADRTTVRWPEPAEPAPEQRPAEHDVDHARAADDTPTTEPTPPSTGETSGPLTTGENERGSDAVATWSEPVPTIETLDVEIAAASIASLCELDPAQEARLENYARSASSPLLLESVLQLLGAPVVAAKYVEGARDLDDLEGLEHYAPRRTGLAMLDALTETPTGSGILDHWQRVIARRPQLLLVLGGAQFAAATGLAAWASRGGRGARVLGTASALLFTDAAGQTGLWAALRARRKR